MQSNLSIFKIGIGPSSSHTLGPLFAGNMFCKKIHDVLDKTAKIKITLFGSLSLTGVGRSARLCGYLGAMRHIS